MIIYFAGLSGINNKKRLQKWIKRGIKYKLISYFNIANEEAKNEFEFLKKGGK
jgi:hypothetical protein